MRIAETVWVIASLAVVFPLRAGDLVADLSAEQLKKIRTGEQILVTQDLKGYPWPRTHFYRLVDATPAEVMAVFFDYNKACGYIPNCTKSQISKVIDARTCEIDYEVAVPILADEAYTVRNTLSRHGPDQMRIGWTMLKSRNVESSEGSMMVEPFEGKTLLRYTNLVKPNSGIAGMLKGFALDQMRDTVTAFAGEVESQKRRNPRVLSVQVERLNKALDGGPPAGMK